MFSNNAISINSVEVIQELCVKKFEIRLFDHVSSGVIVEVGKFVEESDVFPPKIFEVIHVFFVCDEILDLLRLTSSFSYKVNDFVQL